MAYLPNHIAKILDIPGQPVAAPPQQGIERKK